MLCWMLCRRLMMECFGVFASGSLRMTLHWAVTTCPLSFLLLLLFSSCFVLREIVFYSSHSHNKLHILLG